MSGQNLYFSRSIYDFARNFSNFQGVSSALEITFQIPALFKEFKDLKNLYKP